MSGDNMDELPIRNCELCKYGYCDLDEWPCCDCDLDYSEFVPEEEPNEW